MNDNYRHNVIINDIINNFKSIAPNQLNLLMFKITFFFETRKLSDTEVTKERYFKIIKTFFDKLFKNNNKEWSYENLELI